MSNVTKILGSVFRSVFLSAVMIIVGLSVLTGKFPPDIDTLKKSIAGLKTAPSQSDSEILSEAREGTDAELSHLDSAEADVNRLEKINQLRGQMGAKLIPKSLLGSTGGPGAEGGASSPPLNQEQLENKVRQLQQDLFRLQDRVNRIEALQHKNSPTDGTH